MRFGAWAVVLAASASGGCGLQPYPSPPHDERPIEQPAPETDSSIASTSEVPARQESWLELGAPAAMVDGCRAFLARSRFVLWSADESACVPHRMQAADEGWTVLSMAGSPPVATWYTATADEHLVVYGYDGNEHHAAAYDTTSDSWSAPMAVAMGDEPQEVAALSAGSSVLLWGGYDTDPSGAAQKTMPRFLRYDNGNNSWSSIAQAPMPVPRYDHAAVWDSHHMFVFGGRDYQGALLADAGVYDLGNDAWELVGDGGAPSARIGAAMAWTGFVYVVFGGSEDGQTFLSDGAIYCPEPCWSWQSMTAPNDFAPRHPRALWTGEHVVVMQTTDAPLALARYLPDTDSWQRFDPPAALEDFVVVDVHWDWEQHRALLWGHHQGRFSLWVYYPPYRIDPSRGHPGDNLAGNQAEP